MNVLKTSLLATALVVAGVSSAHAATTTTSFQVTANVSGKCLTASATALAFGAYDPVGANASAALDQTNTISVRCTKGTTATVTLDDGVNQTTGSTDAVPLRRMVHGTDTTAFLAYELYSDSGRTQTWGNTAATGKGFTHALLASQATVLTVYGRVPGGQADAIVGNYSDTVAVTVTF